MAPGWGRIDCAAAKDDVVAASMTAEEVGPPGGSPCSSGARFIAGARHRP